MVTTAPRRPGRTGGPRDLNRRERTRALLDAALHLFLEHGIDGVTIDDITQAAGVAKGTFYRYFDDKPALVDALIAPVRSAALSAMERAARDMAHARSEEHVLGVYRELGKALTALLLHTGEVRLYLQENRGPPRGARMRLVDLGAQVSQLAIRLSERAHATGRLRPMHPAVSALAVTGAVERLLLAVLRDEPVGSPLDIPEALASMVLDGLRAHR